MPTLHLYVHLSHSITHAVKETHNTKTTFTLIFICKNMSESTMQHSLQQKDSESKKFSHTIKQLLHQ